MHNIAVIGVGNLGLRHLQSLSERVAPTALFAVDQSEQFLEAAVRHIDAHPGRNANVTLSVLRHVHELPRMLDFVVVATAADVRLKILRELLANNKVTRFLLLEKVLFQRQEDYKECMSMLTQHKVEAFVNCPLRTYDIYATVKTFFEGSPLRLMTVSGGEWGLGCNAIHFLDLFAYLTGNIATRFDLQLDSEARASKRRGFLEFTGTMRGETASSSIVLTAGYGAHPRRVIVLFSGDRYCTVDESEGVARMYEEYALKKEVRFNVPYQSQLTLPIAEDLLQTGTCGLTPYAEAAAIHLPFVNALIHHCKNCIDLNLDYAPIT